MIDLTTRTTGDDNHTLVMEISGRADAISCQFLFDCMEGHLQSGYRRIVLDCSGLESISSYALGELLRANRHLGVALSLVAVRGKIANFLRIAHLNRLVNMFDTVDETVGAQPATAA